ncbi:hypothetical protein BS50DRAFT_573546 [Corynespora cassiicola Philippines]|uniref:RING-type E3 ubiquitin transferase n=1 Tax=Corynespora cassiicola Philippines TaxID=1448308 RepID=A0A2T2NNT3_CORCC|nr:hypothetical protein BS50DRAFT_573546 [Corynespora cassiicola Philippines]
MPSQLHSFPIFSMTNAQESLAIFDQIDNLAIADKYFVNIALVGRGGGTGANSNNDDNNRQGQNPLGPSPSTAVAMIILYSITGIITALFLVIIVTGAVRAHRNPERYGPRNVLGRPRQSRARGLGRAILDTIPIVKFGERDPPKPTDVELGSTAEARDVNDANTNATTDASGNVNANATPTAAAEETAAQTQPVQDQAGAETAKSTAETSTQASVAEQPSGIAPAETLAAGAAGAAAAAGGAQSNAGNEENLGCSICTEDFEKGQDIRVLPCDHKFHPECVDPWLLNVSGTCPLW